MATVTKKKKMSPQIRAQRISRARHIDGVLVDFATETPEQERMADSFWGDVRPRVCSHNAYRMSEVVQRATRTALAKHNSTLDKDASGKPETAVTSMFHVRDDIQLERARTIAVASLCADGRGVLEYLDVDDQVATFELEGSTDEEARAHVGAMFTASPHMGTQITQLYDAGKSVDDDAKVTDDDVWTALEKKDYACSLRQTQGPTAGGAGTAMSELFKGSEIGEALTRSLEKLEDISASVAPPRATAAN